MSAEARDFYQYESPRTPEAFYLRVVQEHFEVIKRNINPNAGLCREFEIGIGVPEKASIGETAMDFIGPIEAREIIKHLDPESSLIDDIGETVAGAIHAQIRLLNVPRWTDRLNQDIRNVRHFYTIFEDPLVGAPEVHVAINGDPLDGFKQNQPHAWGLFLLMVGRAETTGIIDKYTRGEIDPNDNEMQFIETVVGYLCSIEPAIFECVAKDGETELKCPSNRSGMLMMADGLAAVCHLLDPDFQKKVRNTIDDIMTIGVRKDVNTDRIDPNATDGASLAMLEAIALPDSKETAIH